MNKKEQQLEEITPEQLLNPYINIRLGIQSLRDGMIKCSTTVPWKIAEFHHYGRCLDTPTHYGRWITRQLTLLLDN